MLAQHISTTIADFYLGHYNTTPPEQYQTPLTACHYYDTIVLQTFQVLLIPSDSYGIINCTGY